LAVQAHAEHGIADTVAPELVEGCFVLCPVGFATVNPVLVIAVEIQLVDAVFDQ